MMLLEPIVGAEYQTSWLDLLYVTMSYFGQAYAPFFAIVLAENSFSSEH